MLRLATTIAITVIASIMASAQTADERVGALLNGAKWFELREFYETNTDSISPFLDAYAKAMLGHFFNNPHQTATNCADLLNNHSAELDLGNLIAVSQIMSVSLNRMGDNATATNLLESILQATRQYLDEDAITGIESQIERYKQLAKYSLYEAESTHATRLPFVMQKVGKPGKESYALTFAGARLNGQECSPILDTGAGVNVISDSLCSALGLRRLDASTSVMGTGQQQGGLAIADTLQLGNIVLHNVPFHVVNFTSGNDEADSYGNHMELVLGIELMNLLKHFTIDFSANEIVVDSQPFIPTTATTNMCYNGLSNLSVLCKVNGLSALLTADTGNASFGMLYEPKLSELKSMIPIDAVPEKLRSAGFGGISEIESYTIVNLPLEIAGTQVYIPKIHYMKGITPTDQQSGDSGGIGIETFMLYKSVSFDMERMIMYPAK